VERLNEQTVREPRPRDSAIVEEVSDFTGHEQEFGDLGVAAGRRGLIHARWRVFPALIDTNEAGELGSASAKQPK